MRKQCYFRRSHRALLAWDVDRLVELSRRLLCDGVVGVGAVQRDGRDVVVRHLEEVVLEFNVAYRRSAESSLWRANMRAASWSRSTGTCGKTCRPRSREGRATTAEP